MKPIHTTMAIAAFVAFLTGCAAYRQPAHDGWTQWKKSSGGNGHWYKAVAVTNGISWAEADRLARAEGGYLATVTTAAENDFVFSLVNAPSFFKLPNGGGPLFGGFQREGAKEPDGGWSWVTGEPWNYTNWYPGQPDNWWGGPGAPRPEDRLHYYSGIDSKPAPTWNDVTINNHGLTGYIIERDR